jgi:hypothetical protein
VRTTTARVAEQDPRCSTPNDPAGSLRRGELAAGLATAALIGQLLFAPVTLLIAATLVAVGRVSRWHPQWLLVPAVAGLIWLLEAGAMQAAGGFASSSRHWAGYLLAAAVHPARLAHPGAAFAGAVAWSAGQMPLALLAAAGEGSIVLWLGWWRAWRDVADRGRGPAANDRGAWARGSKRAVRQTFRSGLVTLVRRRVSAAALSAGCTVTTDGCALGFQASTGRLAGVSWRAAESGVLLTGASRADLEQLGLAALRAALRLRKTVLLVDLTEVDVVAAGVTGVGLTTAGVSGASLAGRATALASAVGVAASEISLVTVGEPELRPGRSRADAPAANLIGRAVRSGGVVVIPADSADAAQRVIDYLAGVLVGLRDLGLRADCVVWISGCEVVNHDSLAGLVGLGPETGTAVLLSTVRAAHAAGLASVVGTIVAAGPISGNLATQLATPSARIGRQVANAAPLRAAIATPRPTSAAPPAEIPVGNYAIEDVLRMQSSGMFTMLAGTQPGAGAWRFTAGCRAVPLTVGDVR